MRIALNGFGRIGQSFLRAVLQEKKSCKDFEIVVINVGPADPEHIAYSFKYDTVMRTFPGFVAYHDGVLTIGDCQIPVISEPNIQKIAWGEYDIDWVVDASGVFTRRKQAQLHLKQGAKNVLISAPAQDPDVSIVLGVNNADYNPKKHKIVSLGSCTTNAVIPMLHVLCKHVGIESASMTTIHAYTNSQSLLDTNAEGKNIRRSRAAAENIVPTSTGAQRMIDEILPELSGSVIAQAVRVPVADVSLIDLSFVSKKNVSAREINQLFENESQGSLSNVLAINQIPLVSSDYIGNCHSVTIDGLSTIFAGNMGKVFGWYDNEWGYSCRLRDFLIYASAE